MPSSNTDTDGECSEAVGFTIEATTDSAGSSLDQLGASPTPAAGSDSGSGLTTEPDTSNQTQYFQVVEESMNPLLPPGSIIEIVSENYTEGDVVVAQKSDGTYIIKMLVDNQLVPLGAGAKYAAADVNIMGAAALSSLSAEDLELSGLLWSTVLAQTATLPTGSGIALDPYIIASLENLYWITADISRWSAYYKQTENIDATATYSWGSGAGWTPIGTGATAFTGTYNGQGFTISNLFINRPSDNFQGLFGVTSGATLTNIGLTDVDVTGQFDVGGLVGQTHTGTISNSYATGVVKGEQSNVGGLVGHYISGTITNSYATGAVSGPGSIGGLVGYILFGSISNSYATGAVTGNTDVGGLVGWNYFGSISNSYATGAVTGTDYNIGGLVGCNQDGTITNSYATGAVTGNTDVGGLVGLNNAIITNSYATGAVTGGTNVGGLVGFSGGTISYSYYDKDTTGQTDTGKGIPKNTAEMKTLSTFQSAGWTIVAYDPNTAPASGWFIRAGSYPQLYWEWTPPAPEPVSGFNFSGISFTLPPLPASGSALTAISGKGANPIITPAFVTGGSAADLGRAVAAYNQAKQRFEANKGTMGAADKAVAEVELAVANAAILALELSLAAQGGQAGNLSALIAAYQAALAVLNSNRGLLTTEQIAAAEELLKAIATVISRFSS
ncbi:MAG: GLUG motif-containing protein [Dethiobacteria bacterium]|nr:GLUG motif-containing protein [Dethiobacteria bacterium]